MTDIQIRTRCPCRAVLPVRLARELVALLLDLQAPPSTVLVTVRCRHCQAVTVIRLADFDGEIAA